MAHAASIAKIFETSGTIECHVGAWLGNIIYRGIVGTLICITFVLLMLASRLELSWEVLIRDFFFTKGLPPMWAIFEVTIQILLASYAFRAEAILSKSKSRAKQIMSALAVVCVVLLGFSVFLVACSAAGSASKLASLIPKAIVATYAAVPDLFSCM